MITRQAPNIVVDKNKTPHRKKRGIKIEQKPDDRVARRAKGKGIGRFQVRVRTSCVLCTTLGSTTHGQQRNNLEENEREYVRTHARTSSHRHNHQQHMRTLSEVPVFIVPLFCRTQKSYKRWRMEDLPWKVTCVNRITGENRDVPFGEFNEGRGYCNQPEEYKVRVHY